MNARREPFWDCGLKYWLFVFEKGSKKTQTTGPKNRIHKPLRSRGVVGFDNCCSNLRAAPHSERDLALFAVIHLRTQFGFTNRMQRECKRRTELPAFFNMRAVLNAVMPLTNAPTSGNPGQNQCHLHKHCRRRTLAVLKENCSCTSGKGKYLQFLLANIHKNRTLNCLAVRTNRLFAWKTLDEAGFPVQLSANFRILSRTKSTISLPMV